MSRHTLCGRLPDIDHDMKRFTAVIVFLVFQVTMAGVWLWLFTPLWGGGDESAFFSSTVQVWSRTGEATEAALRFRPWGDVWSATQLLAGSAAALAGGWLSFKAGRNGVAAGLVGLALIAGAAAAWLVARQWAGATLFPEGAVNTDWLRAVTRAWLVQFFAGFALLVAFMGLLIAEHSNRNRPLGFHLVALNWMIVVVVWVAAYLALYLAPSMGQGG